MAQVRPIKFILGKWKQFISGDTIFPDNLGTGTRDGTKYLRDDGTWQSVTAGASTFNPNLYITTSDQTLPSNSSVCFPSEYEIGNGFVTTISSDSILAIV